jgi:hypothetical protein
MAGKAVAADTWRALRGIEPAGHKPAGFFQRNQGARRGIKDGRPRVCLVGDRAEAKTFDARDLVRTGLLLTAIALALIMLLGAT